MKKRHLLLTAREAKAIDEKAKFKFGISTLVLMENAGRSIAEGAYQIAKGRKKIAIFCGKGNNGGDGFVAARHLLALGLQPDIYLVGRIFEVKNEARVNLDILLKLKQRIIELNERNLNLVEKKILRYNLIIDALLGVGLSGLVRGLYEELIRLINSSPAHILSIDIPSGLDATSGEVLGLSVKADTTITFIAKKKAMLLAKAKRYCGRIIVKDLGIPI